MQTVTTIGLDIANQNRDLGSIPQHGGRFFQEHRLARAWGRDQSHDERSLIGHLRSKRLGRGLLFGSDVAVHRNGLCGHGKLASWIKYGQI